MWLVTQCACVGVTLTNLHSLAIDTNGVFPTGGLLLATDGNFYGTTSGVRMNGQGGRRIRPTIFRMTPDGVFATLAWFDATNIDRTGPGPWHSDETLTSGLVQASDGNFYGVAEMGGRNGYGRVFKMTSAGAITTLLSFAGYYSNDGWGPQSGLVEAEDGCFYGTAYNGGIRTRDDNVGMGTVYKVATNGAFRTVFKFTGTNGEFPASELIIGKDGNFYGTTPYGGPLYAKGPPEQGFGTVFKLTPSGALTSLFSFSGTNGAQPYAGLTQGSDGCFYGATRFGGVGFKTSEPGVEPLALRTFGTVFRISPSGDFTSLFSFNGTNGARPHATLVQGLDSNLYGTTEYGGEGYRGPSAGIDHLFNETFGTIFRIGTNGNFASLFSFSRTNGAHPVARLVEFKRGQFYGTTRDGGAGGAGTVFRVRVPPAP
jgi:uncharacterized repeat protein (TIGR03803 family)